MNSNSVHFCSCALDMDMRRVVGPMVNQSDAPFRVLCLKYGATCAYSEMLYSSRIVREAKYLDAYVPACDAALLGCFCPESTTGLVVQICGYGFCNLNVQLIIVGTY